MCQLVELCSQDFVRKFPCYKAKTNSAASLLRVRKVNAAHSEYVFVVPPQFFSYIEFLKHKFCIKRKQLIAAFLRIEIV